MRINNNISALNTYRQYTNNTSAANKSMEKLSSGLRINRAGDDAAGLAISEKMRAQIRGIDMAAKNSQDAISLVQTAEGALTETHSILQRMRELAVQSSSDTNETIDRDALQAEFKQLQSEIDDIADQTQFNNLNLLNGAYAGATTKVTNSGLNAAKVSIKSTAAAAVATNVSLAVSSFSAAPGATPGAKPDASTNWATAGNYTVSAVDTTNVAEGTAKNGTYTLVVTAGTNANTMKYSLEDSDGNAVAGTEKDNQAINLGGNTVLDFGAYGSITVGETGGNEADFITAANGKTITLENGTDPVASTGKATAKIGTVAVTQGDRYVELAGGVKMDLSKLTDADWASSTALEAAIGTGATYSIEAVAAKEALTIQTGANETQTMGININDMSTTALGVDTATVRIDSRADASSAITTVDDAIKTVSTQRAALGAMQNRLDHKINNLNTSSENLQAAESRIRDVDMAKEMVEFTKNNILLQAAQSMLAQANAQPQGVLQLLQ